MGGCFKTRINGLTERAETIYSQIKYFVKVLCEHVIRAFWHACYAQVALHMICKCNIDSGQSLDNVPAKSAAELSVKGASH